MLVRVEMLKRKLPVYRFLVGRKPALILGAAVIYILGPLSASWPVLGQELTIAHVEYTSNWNAISSRSRTAQLAAKLTHEALFVERCIGAASSQRSSFIPWCIQPAMRVSVSGSIALNLNVENCGVVTKSLVPDDVRWTVNLINRTTHNRFWPYKMRVDASDKLWIGYPSPISDWTAKSILTFPIVRNASRTNDPQGTSRKNLDEKRLSSGDEELANRIAGGKYRYSAIRENITKLELRQRSGASKLERIEFKYFPLMSDLNDVLSGESRPDVVLGVPADIAISSKFYELRYSPDLNSFTYVGFNSKTRDYRARSLFQDVKFRSLFTRSLWATEPIRNGVDISQTQARPRGIFIGESFDAGDPRVGETTSFEDLKVIIDNYLKNAPIKSSVRLTMLLAPDISLYFDRTDRNNIERELNELWRSGTGARVKFRLVDPSGGEAAYRSEKLRNRHHLVFETFKYGRSRARYMAFLDPDSRINELGVDLISSSELSKLLATGNRGRRQFLDLVSELYPVAVVGHFPRRDLHSTLIVKPNLFCPKGSFSANYAGIDLWQRK